MIATYSPSKIKGEIDSVVSKSYAHRALIIGFLANSKVEFNGTNDDIEATKFCLNCIKNNIEILDCNESGSTLRFMLPLASAIGGDFKFIGRGRLLDRPLDDLINALNNNGVKIEKKEDCILLKGKLSSNDFTIRGDVSSQYISGLLMALPLIGGGKITLSTPLSSKSYVDMTIEVMRDFGVNVIEKGNTYIVPNCNYKKIDNYNVAGDWSSASFMLTLGAICGEVKINGLNYNSNQSDKCICDILRECGAIVDIKENSVFVKKNKLNCFSFDADNSPDLVPVACALASFCEGTSIIKNVQRLRLKESDRIKSSIDMLNSVNIRAYLKENVIFVEGGTPTFGTIDSYKDHRIAMSGGVIGANIKGNTTVLFADCVNKSYPTFYEDFIKLGGIINVK